MKKSLGKLGEDIAVGYLLQKGYQILERNYTKPWGEIDVIVEKKRNIIFIEVKTLSRERKGNGNASEFLPEENVTFQKKRKLIRAAKMYLWENEYFSDRIWQIDVIGIELLERNRCRLRHTEKAIGEINT